MPTKNKIEDLRNHLFETLEALKDKDEPMDIARAKAVADVAKVIVETAKVEVNYMRVTGGVASTGFLPDEPEAIAAASKRLNGRQMDPRA